MQLDGEGLGGGNASEIGLAGGLKFFSLCPKITLTISPKFKSWLNIVLICDKYILFSGEGMKGVGHNWSTWMYLLFPTIAQILLSKTRILRTRLHGLAYSANP